MVAEEWLRNMGCPVARLQDHILKVAAVDG